MGAGLCSELSREFGSWREDQGRGERQRWQQLSHVAGLEFGVWFCCGTNSGLARGVSSARTEGSFADELHRISLGSAASVSAPDLFSSFPSKCLEIPVLTALPTKLYPLREGVGIMALNN